MNVSVALSAPACDHEHGASRKSVPIVFNSAPIRLLSLTEIVLQSTIVNGPLFPAASPSAPRITSRDIFVSPTHRNAHSLRLATSAGLAHAVAPFPSAAIASALPFVCDHSATSCPART